MWSAWLVLVCLALGIGEQRTFGEQVSWTSLDGMEPESREVVQWSPGEVVWQKPGEAEHESLGWE